jgi:hypothetical protein
MDFIVGLPESAGYTCIWVVVDRLTKMAHFTPCRETIDAHELAALFLKHIIRLHGMPINIVSHRGTLFTSAFWRSLLHAPLPAFPRRSTLRPTVKQNELMPF